MPRPRIAALLLSLGAATIAASERRLPAEALACPRSVFRGCAPEGPALKCALKYLSSPPDFDLETLKASMRQLPHETFQLFCDAVHRFTARTSSAVALFTVEDALGDLLQVNIPGTADADRPDPINKTYPNWRKRFQVVVEAFAAHPQIQRVSQAFREERP